MKKLFSSTYFWPCFAALLAIFMVNTPLANYPQLVDKGPTWLGLDVSWTMTLNYALLKHLVWGKDILYTYGPLAIFATRVGWGVSRWVFLLFDCFIVVNFYFVFIDFLKSSTDKFLAVFVLICIVLVVNTGFGPDLSWIILFLIIYWIVKTFNQPQLAYMIMLIVLTVLAFYIKMNTGLIGFLFLGAHLINLVVCKKLSWVRLLAYVALVILLVSLSAWLLHVAVFDYISGSFDIIKGYNDIMYLDEKHSHIEYNLYLLSFAMAAYFLSQLIWPLKNKNYGQLLYPLLCVAFIFLLQKQSILRNDVQHLYEYFSFAPVLLLCRFPGKENSSWQLKASLIMVLYALFFVSETRTIDVSLIKRVTGPGDYLQQFKSYNPATYLTQKDKRIIPQSVLNSIGNKTVDVFPWDSEYLLENKLNYAPRPVFQSFSVYTAALEKMNYDYYLKAAPQYLIYDYDAIDNRYPFNEEGLVNLFILNNYKLTDTFTSNERQRLVLKRNVKTAPLQFTSAKKQPFFMNTPIIPKGFNFIKLDLHYSLRGKLKTLLHRPPHLQICYQRSDGQMFYYKTSIELLKSGLFVGDLITDDNDYRDLLTGKHACSIKQITLNYDGQYFNAEGISETSQVNCIPQSVAKQP